MLILQYQSNALMSIFSRKYAGPPDPKAIRCSFIVIGTLMYHSLLLVMAGKGGAGPDGHPSPPALLQPEPAIRLLHLPCGQTAGQHCQPDPDPSLLPPAGLQDLQGTIAGCGRQAHAQPPATLKGLVPASTGDNHPLCSSLGRLEFCVYVSNHATSSSCKAGSFQQPVPLLCALKLGRFSAVSATIQMLTGSIDGTDMWWRVGTGHLKRLYFHHNEKQLHCLMA